MRTIQMTLDEELVADLDEVVKQNNSNRSAFTSEALRKAINHYKQTRLVEKHRKGYERFPVTDDEFADWEDEYKKAKLAH